MFRNTYATVGQNQRRELLYARKVRVVQDGKLQIANWSPFPLPPSPFRRGITLTEVLISLGILTIGLLGVAALFPVGSYYMQRGEVADRGSAIAQAAFNEVVARGMLNPDRWIVMTTPQQMKVDPVDTSAMRPKFSRPFASSLAEGLVRWGGNEMALSRHFGNTYVIDPMGAAAMSEYSNPDRFQLVARSFPSGVSTVDVQAMNYAWQWRLFNDQQSWPVRRITFWQPSNNVAERQRSMTADVTDRLFRATDDLAFELPDQADRPAIQRWDLATTDLNGDGNNGNDPLARQSRGDYSWIVTVAPMTADARDAMATGRGSARCEVSVAVFYKRVLPTSVPTDGTQFLNAAATERLVKARVVSTGLNGGELLLERQVDGITTSPFDDLKNGNWVFVCGPHPNSTDERPVFIARWYRVLSIEGEDARLNSQASESPVPASSEPERRLVALRGPQWPWQPEPSGNLSNNSNLANSLCVAIIPNVVAVHAKTIRLEGDSVWSGGAVGLGGSRPPGSPNVGY